MTLGIIVGNRGFFPDHLARSGRKVFLDARQQKPFPLNISTANLKVHKIVVAHGAKEACAAFSDANVYGSLAVTYRNDAGDSALPFMINLDKADPIHVLDSHNLPIILGELDTIFELSRYLDAKADAIARLDCFSYCGEEDLLAHYLLNFDKEKKQHYIGVRDETVNGVHIGEGEWKDFVELAVYKNTKAENRISYACRFTIHYHLPFGGNWRDGASERTTKGTPAY